MKAISLWEPWGTAIARGLKHFETRGWSTNYRGPLAIHCAQRKDEASYVWEAVTFKCAPDSIPIRMGRALASVGVTGMQDLAFGKVVAVCELADCKSTDDLFFSPAQLDPVERLFGNYEPGRFAWRLENVRPMIMPFAFRGAQGFFNVPNELFNFNIKPTIPCSP